MTKKHYDLFLESGAIFSKCEKYRYDLWRFWDFDKDYVAFILLNPSTADETVDDPTVAKCQRYARRWGYGGLHVLNVFPLRATDPKTLYKKRIDAMACVDNADKIIEICKHSGKIVCGWGNHADKVFRISKSSGKGEWTARLLTGRGFKLYALSENKNGSPQHPLYLPENLSPVRYRR